MRTLIEELWKFHNALTFLRLDSQCTLKASIVNFGIRFPEEIRTLKYLKRVETTSMLVGQDIITNDSTAFRR